MNDLRERVAEVLASRVWDKSETAAKEVIALIVEECAKVADANAHDECDVAEQIAAAIRALAKWDKV